MEAELNITNKYEYDYLRQIERTINHGFSKGDRTGTGTFSLFAQTLRVDISDGKIPLLFSRQCYPRSWIHETLWFLSGSTDVKYLKDNNVGIWDEWVRPESAVFEDTDKLDYKNVYNWIRCSEPGIYPQLRQKFPNGTTVEELSKWVRDTFELDLPKKKLVGGDIGPGAYGSLWRKWEDTRVVEKEQEQLYYNRGYKFVTDVPRGANWNRGPGVEKEYVVVNRTIDQIADVIKQLKTNPDSRRIILTAWNPGRIEDAVLPSCHSFIVFNTREMTLEECKKAIGDPILQLRNLTNGTVEELLAYLELTNQPRRVLSCCLVMRSSDTVLGEPSNLPQYAMLTHMLAQVTGMVAGELVYVGVDAHVYKNHLEGVQEQLSRESKILNKKSAKMLLNPMIENIDDFKFEDFRIVGYEDYLTPIKFPIAV